MLIRTKPLGTGVTIMAARARMAGEAHEAEANRCMSALNREAAQIALSCGASSCTDVTGFGLLGHAVQMAEASGVSMEIDVRHVPKLDGVLTYAGMGLLSAAAYANRNYLAARVQFAPEVELAQQDLLLDPQTSGGLLFALPADRADAAIARAKETLSTTCAVIGRVGEHAAGPRITVRRGD